MGQFQASVVLPRPRGEAFNYLRVPANLLKMFPERTTRHVDARLPDQLDLGASMEFNIRALGSRFQIVQQITDFLHGEKIVATQQKGPFKLWVHELHLADAPEGGTLLTNSIRFEPPGGLLGFIATRKLILNHLEEWVAHGHENLR